ncbi:hypothetical protein Dimus_001609 [Dionaea muscipula]
MMDRNREARRAALVTAPNGLPRRRQHRTSSSLRDSPEDDAPADLLETGRLRDRPVKKERERDRDRDRSGRCKRRRSDKFIGGGREDGGDDSSEESVNDEDEEDPDDGPVRYVAPNPVPMMSSSATSSLTNHHHHQRKSYPPPSNKVFRPVAPTWKAPDEMIGVSIPRKARSASTKRPHDTWSSGAGEPNQRQASPSPVRSSVVSAQAGSSSPSPMSPSSSNASMKKKIPNGPKQKPPKCSSKSSPSIQDDLEIEVAEVLFGLMRQSQGPAKPDDHAKPDSRDINRSSGRVLSPVSNSTSVSPQPPPVMQQNSSSPVAAPLTTVAPKRKRPRPVTYQVQDQSVFVGRSGPAASHLKADVDHVSNHDGPSASLEKKSVENGGVTYDSLNSQTRPDPSVAQLQSVKPDHRMTQNDSKASMGESESRDSVRVKMEEALVSIKELPGNRLDSSTMKVTVAIDERGNHWEEKFEIDLMAPPPQIRSPPERGGQAEYGGREGGGGGGPDGEARKSMVMVADREAVGDGGGAGELGDKIDKVVCSVGDGVLNAADGEDKQPNRPPAAATSNHQVLNPVKDRSVDVELVLENADKGAGRGVGVEKSNTQPLKQKTASDDANADKTGQSSSLQLQMSAAAAAAGWPGGLPPMGYVAPLQGVVSIDGSTMAPHAIQPPHLLFSQPRPKRCATHGYIARNIQCHQQQLIKMNPFWPPAVAAAASSPLFGGKPPYNLNVVPSVDLLGNVAGRSINPVQDKGSALAFFPGQPAAGKEKVPTAAPAAAASVADGAQNKQFLLQQSLPPGAPANILQGPAFIFPLGGQQQAAAAFASARPTSVKLGATAGSAASTSTSGSTPVAATSTVPAVSPAMSFNFPNMPANETQYLAILGNSAYPFPIAAHVGAAPTYRGGHAQAMPFFNGSFYPSQILHPSQLQTQQPLQGHQPTNGSNAASSSQKHLHNQQLGPQGAATNGSSSNPSLQSFPAPKIRATTQPPQNEMGSEDSPSTGSRQSIGLYGPNFTLPIHPTNFLLTSTALTGATSAGGSSNGSQAERKQQHHSQQPPALKSLIESITPPAFAMSFASINNTAPGLDMSAGAQNHAILQRLPEAARNNYQSMATAATAQASQQKKGYRPEESKVGAGDRSNGDEERKAIASRASASGGHGQSIAFTRSDLPETSVNAVTGISVADSSARSVNLMSGEAHSSRSSVPNAMGNASGSNSQQQQQMVQLQKQHQYAAAAATRGKTPTMNNGSVYNDHLSSSSSKSAKFPSGISGFPPSLVQNSASPGQSPQWKSASRPAASQVSSSSIPVSTSNAIKNLPLQESRNQQGHTQISFCSNPKSSSASQVPSSHQAPSPPMTVGSSSTSSISRSTSGSPRMTVSTSTGNKALPHATSLSSHPGKNSSSVPCQKSSPVGGRNAPSILGGPHISTSSGKSQRPQQLLQQPQSKQAIQQTQLYFSNAYAQPPPNGSTSSAAATASGYYLQRHRPEQQSQPGQKSQSSAPQRSSGILPLSPVSGTTDPAKAVAAAAASNMKGGLLQSPGVLHATPFSGQPPSTIRQLVPAGFPCVPAAPATVQVKPAEQNQPTAMGNTI